MSRITTFIFRLLIVFCILLVLGGIGAAVYFGVDRLIEWWSVLDRSVSLVLIACLTAYVSARSIAKGLVRARKQVVDDRQCQRRARLYRRLIRNWLATRPNERVGAKEQDLLLWGSPEVIRRYLDLVHAPTKGPPFVKAVEEWLRAIRNDIGSRNDVIEYGDLATLLTKYGIFERAESSHA